MGELLSRDGASGNGASGNGASGNGTSGAGASGDGAGATAVALARELGFGADTVEVLPGGTLTGLAKRGLKGTAQLAVKTPEDLDAARAFLAEHSA